jgi:hypothetical protein
MLERLGGVRGVYWTREYFCFGSDDRSVTACDMVHACHMLRNPITSLTTGDTDTFLFCRALIRMHKIQIVLRQPWTWQRVRLRIEF